MALPRGHRKVKTAGWLTRLAARTYHALGLSTWDATLWIGLEAGAIAIAGAALGASAVRLRVLALLVIGHAIVVTAAWQLAGGPGDGAALARARILLSAELLLAWAAAAALCRLRVDRGSAAAAAALLMLALVVAPAPGEAVAQAGGDRRARTLAHAASPAFAATATLGLDVLHEPALYGRLPAAAMEMHMTPWIWTTGGYLFAATLLSLLALRRRPRHAATLAAALVALVATGCKKDEAKKQEAPAPAKASKDSGAEPVEPDQPATPVTKAATAQDVQKAIDTGIAFLAKGRSADGLIGGHPGTTALATWAMVSAEGAPPADDPLVKPSLDALVKLAKPDGAIFDKDYPVYVTAITVLALQRAKVEPALVEKAQRWLADKQFANQDGVSETSVNFGGIGYGVDDKHPDADLSNLHFALDALQDSTLKDRPEVLERAQKFLERCQNRTESNDQDWASNDGGFVYKPGASKAGGTASSASMTYAGVASFLYADVDPKDPRLAAALDWLRGNYSVDENPGLGQKGLYYHFHMMSRALGLLGQRTVVDADEQAHDWPVELATKLLSLQKPDGSWANPDATYWEDNPAIATSRAVLALEHALAAMK